MTTEISEKLGSTIMIQGTVNGETFQNECKKHKNHTFKDKDGNEQVGIDPTKTIFIFPGNDQHSTEIFDKSTGGGGLADAANQIVNLESSCPVLGLPTKFLTLRAPKNKYEDKLAIAKRYYHRLWHAVGEGYNICIPVRDSAASSRKQGVNWPYWGNGSGPVAEQAEELNQFQIYFENNNIEPSFYGENQIFNYKVDGRLPLEHLQQLNAVCEFQQKYKACNTREERLDLIGNFKFFNDNPAYRTDLYNGIQRLPFEEEDVSPGIDLRKRSSGSSSSSSSSNEHLARAAAAKKQAFTPEFKAEIENVVQNLEELCNDVNQIRGIPFTLQLADTDADNKKIVKVQPKERTKPPSEFTFGMKPIEGQPDKAKYKLKAQGENCNENTVKVIVKMCKELARAVEGEPAKMVSFTLNNIEDKLKLILLDRVIEEEVLPDPRWLASENLLDDYAKLIEKDEDKYENFQTQVNSLSETDKALFEDLEAKIKEIKINDNKVSMGISR